MKRIIYILVVVLALMITGCNVNDTATDTPEYLGEQEQTEVGKTSEQYENLKIIYGDEIKQKYDTLKRVGVVQFELDNLDETVTDEIVYESVVRLDGLTNIDIDKKSDTVSKADILHGVLTAMYYEVEYEESIELAKNLGIVEENDTEDYFKEASYRDLIDILYESLFANINTDNVSYLDFEEHNKDIEGDMNPIGIISSRNDVSIFSDVVVKKVEHEELQPDIDRGEPSEGEHYLILTDSLDKKLTSIVSEALKYYIIEYEDVEYTITPKGVDNINIDYTDNFMWVYFRFIVEGNGKEYETIQNIYFKANNVGEYVEVGFYDDGLAREMLGCAVIDRQGYDLISKSEDESLYYKLVDEEMNTILDFEIKHGDMTNKIIVEQINN